MGFVNQKSSSCKGDYRKKKEIFKNRNKGIEKKFHEFRTLCGVRALLYVKSEFNRDKNGSGLVRTLPENPNEFREILKDYINYNPGKRKRDTDEGVLDSECTNDHSKMRKFGESSEENQKAKFIDQKSTKLGDLTIEEIQEIERNLNPLFVKISERIDQLKEKNKSGDPSEKGFNEDGDVIIMNEFPSLPLKPEFQYHYSSSTEELFGYNSVLGNEFGYGIEESQPCLNLPWLTNTTSDDDIVLAPFPDVIDFEFEQLSYYHGSFTDMMKC